MTTPRDSSPATGGMKEIYQLKHNLCETSPADVLPLTAGKHVSEGGECDFMLLAVQSLPPAEQAGRGASIYFILVNSYDFRNIWVFAKGPMMT